jgi:hypothetical protein
MDADDKVLTQTERLALVDRDSGGRFVKGHKKSSPGRPVGAVNKLTRSLREQVLDGIGDIPTFIGELKRDSLPACAGLPAKLLPPAENGDDARQGGTVIVNILPIKSGTFILPAHIDERDVPAGLRLVVSNEAPVIDNEPDPAA